MKEYKKVRSTQQPDTLIIDEYSVWLAENITPVTEESTGEESTGFTGYEFDLTQYNKDEYIQKISEKNVSLGNEITSTQVALCEIYELLN